MLPKFNRGTTTRLSMSSSSCRSGCAWRSSGTPVLNNGEAVWAG